MLEILLVYHLCGVIGTKLRKKHVKPTPYQWLLAISWFGGEFFGGFVAGMLGKGDTGFVYLFALVGAAIGAMITFIVVGSVSANPAPSSASASNPITIGPPSGRSDQEAQPLIQAAQACEARQDWAQAMNYWRLAADKAADPQWINYSQQRSQQLYQWLSQQAAVARRPT